MGQKFKDNSRALLQGTISDAATSLTIEASKADRYPVANTSDWGSPADWFKATLIDSEGNREVIKVGTRTLGSGVFGNVLRGQDGTTALAFAAGETVVVHAIFAADIENVLAQNFTGLVTQDGVTGRVVPVGGIIMYDGLIADIPTGYQLCDGTNGTPNLSDKFVIGAWVDSGGEAKTNITGTPTKTGGSKDLIVPSHSHTATFTGSALPAHNHPLTDPTHSHGGVADRRSDSDRGNTSSNFSLDDIGATSASATGITIAAASAGTPAGSVSVASTGSSATNANLVPYYALAFIKCMPPA